MDKTPKILLVDDEPFNIDYLEQELEDLDYEIFSANNGKQALDIIEKVSPDMILLDIMMPVMDGFEVLSKIKADKNWRNIPVVVISAMSDMKSIVKSIELGAEDFLPKPFEPSLLHVRLNACIEKKRLRDLEQKYLRGLERELEIGRKIQAEFLPNEIPQPAGWEIAAYFQAAREVAGDFYDVFEIPKNSIGLILGDVVDKGVGAALYMTLFRSLLRITFSSDLVYNAVEGKNKSKQDCIALLNNAVSFTNNYICRIHHSASYATLFCGILDLKTGSLCYVDAGHEPPLIVNDGQVKREIKPTGPAVGFLEEMDFGVEEIQLQSGDILFVYSDGITDVQNVDGEMLGEAKLFSLLEKPEKSAGSLLNNIISNVDRFMGNAEQYDDISLLALRKN
jgi:serine phosphatase RsbU (regulator of sigma subunit)